MALQNNLRTLRQITSELRRVSSTGNLKDSLPIQYIFNQYEKYKTTDQQLCKAQEEVKYIAHTYLCYLSSLRKYHEINKEYQGKGERSIRETANLVGFKLPHDPK